MEHILTAQLLERLFGAPSLWDVLEKLEDSLPGTSAFVKQVRNSAATPHGRTALWIRHALRERRLGEFLQAMRFHPELVSKSYEPDAPLASEEFVSALLLQLETAAALEFHFLWQEGPELDSSPLVYTHVTMPEQGNAGALVHGTPTNADKKIAAVSTAVVRFSSGNYRSGFYTPCIYPCIYTQHRDVCATRCSSYLLTAARIS